MSATVAPQKSDQVRSALEKVWFNCRPEALARLATLERFTEDLRSGVPVQESREKALAAAHRLSGSLGMFGLHEASSCAAEIEALLDAEPAPDVAMATTLVGRLRSLLEGTQASNGTPKRNDS